MFLNKFQGCCRALTAECLACSKGQSTVDFCAEESNKNVDGCEGISIVLQLKIDWLS